MTLENYAVRNIVNFPSDGLTGRRRITTTVKEITADNVRDVLSDALAIHEQNAGEINYLWDVYRGKQDIRHKAKYVRESINEKVCVNIANQIVTYKSAYLLSEPIQYVSHGGDDELSKKVVQLNEYMRAEDKESKDKEIVDWMHICGLGERFVTTDRMAGIENDAPFYIETLDPRTSFVIYSSRIRKTRMAGVILQTDENKQKFATVYTKNKCFTVTKDSVTEEGHTLGDIPLIEYENNMARMGAFEVVLSILNAINELESDAVDAIKDFVNGFDVFMNCDIENGQYANLTIGGQAVKVTSTVPGVEAKVYRVTSELDQNGVQQRVDDLTEKYLTICGMPNRNGGSSTSDTGTAVIFRDGFFDSESRAEDTETFFKRSERCFLRIVLRICSALEGLDLSVKDIEVNFPRKSLNNLQSRFQCLCEGLANDKIHPENVFNAFGDIFGDKAKAYQMGMEWYEKQKQEQEDAIDAQLERERERITNAVQTGGQGTDETEPGGAETE